MLESIGKEKAPMRLNADRNEHRLSRSRAFFLYVWKQQKKLLQPIYVASEKLFHGMVHRKNTIMLDHDEDPLERAFQFCQDACFRLCTERATMESNIALQLPQNECSPREYSILRARLMQVQGIDDHDWRMWLIGVVFVRGEDFLHH
jgi:hypothetical protein